MTPAEAVETVNYFTMEWDRARVTGVSPRARGRLTGNRNVNIDSSSE